MLNIYNISSNDVQAFAKEKYIAFSAEEQSFEEVAQRWTQTIYKTFLELDDSPTFALVRVFRISEYDDLLPQLQDAVENSASQYWMSLMGTYGIEENWCQRTNSAGHQIFPALSSATPMLKAAFSQIRHLQQFDTSNPNSVEVAKKALANPNSFLFDSFFFVDDANASPHIPAKVDFVQRYGIQSVVGFGTPFVRGGGVLILCFTRRRFSYEDAEKFVSLAPFMTTSLAKLNERDRLWALPE